MVITQYILRGINFYKNNQYNHYKSKIECYYIKSILVKLSYINGTKVYSLIHCYSSWKLT